MLANVGKTSRESCLSYLVPEKTFVTITWEPLNLPSSFNRRLHSTPLTPTNCWGKCYSGMNNPCTHKSHVIKQSNHKEDEDTTIYVVRQKHARPRRKLKSVPFSPLLSPHNFIGFQDYRLHQDIIPTFLASKRVFLSLQKNLNKITKILLNPITSSLTPID